MRIHRVLQRLGLNTNEAKIYVALLRAGEALVSEITRATEIPRSTVQFSIEEMRAKGLVSHYSKRHQTYWVAQSPNHLLADLEERHALLERALPEMRRLRHTSDERPRCLHYDGVSGVCAILQEVAHAHYETKLYGAFAELANLLEPATITDFFTDMRAQHVPMQVLIPQSDYAEELRRHLLPGTHSLRFSADEDGLSALFVIFGNQLGIIGCQSQWFQGILYEDRAVADTARSLFATKWEQGCPVSR